MATRLPVLGVGHHHAMSDSNTSKDLDGDVLGEDVGDDGLPGIGDYPPDQAQGVNDPNLVASDDVVMREARHRAGVVDGDDDRVGDLLPPDGDDGLFDDEQQAVATTGEANHADRADPPAEVAAMRERGER